MSNKQTKCPECGSYKMIAFYTPKQQILLMFSPFLKPDKLRLKCDNCGYIFEIPNDTYIQPYDPKNWR